MLVYYAVMITVAALGTLARYGPPVVRRVLQQRLGFKALHSGLSKIGFKASVPDNSVPSHP